MARVFLSYDHDDADRARPIAVALEKAGHAVWWDLHIKAGAQYGHEIEGALKQADAVVVLWSKYAVDSAWVRDEAAAGRDSGRLVPVLLDGTEPPLGFRQYQNIDLSHWSGRSNAPAFREILAAISSLGSDGGIADEPPKRPIFSLRPRRRWLLAGLALAFLFAAVATWRLARTSEPIPTVAFAAADASPVAKELSRGLFTRLGRLHAAKTDSVRLVEGGGGNGGSADLIFELSGSDDRGRAGANLVLLAGKDRSLLWSMDFQRQSDGHAELEQRMAYTAAQVLGCALEAAGQRVQLLDQQTLKLFLNGCALASERYRADQRAVAPIFLEVVARAPRFEPAWAKLLLAEAQIARAEILFFDRWMPGALPEHIRAVRKLNSQLPELYVAESALLPITAFAERSRLYDEAVRLNPENPHLRVIRSEFLSFVGYMGESVDEARRAAELDPLSPGVRSNLIQALAYAGRLDAAREELRRAEQLWPGTPTIVDARFRLNSRYGDANDALLMLKKGATAQLSMTPDLEAFLLARNDPSDANVQRAIDATRTSGLNETRSMMQLAQLLGEFGREEELYRAFTQWRQKDRLGIILGIIFRPPLHKFRQDPRFMQLAYKGGLADHWRKSGKWPDFCLEPDQPYDCKAEAAKLAA